MMFQGKMRTNVESENNQQKMEILFTERSDSTPLVVVDWMKTFRLTIGRLQLAENEKRKRS